MRSRRGLTLLEVLASTTLLAVMAAACMPLLRQAVRDSYAVEPPFDLADLGDFADAFIANGSAQQLEQPRTELPWPGVPDRAPVIVERFGAEDFRHAWIGFRAGPWTVFRWVAMPDQPGSPQDGRIR